MKSFFKSIISGEDEYIFRPIIVITCDAREQLRGLGALNVQVDDWEIGLSTLFDAHAPVYKDPREQHSNRERERSRSRSPVPSSRNATEWGKTRERSPSRRAPRSEQSETRPERRKSRRSRPPVYVIDIMDLWEILPNVGLTYRDGQSELRKMARKLDINCELDSWCAGHDVE